MMMTQEMMNASIYIYICIVHDTQHTIKLTLTGTISWILLVISQNHNCTHVMCTLMY